LLCLGIADLEDLSRSRDIQWTCDAATGRHTLRAGRSQIVFLPGMSSALVNGAPFALSSPVTIESGRVKLPPELAKLVGQAPFRRAVAAVIVLPKSAPGAEPREPEARPRPGTLLTGLTIAIDPGHGGAHTGGVGRTGLMEKDINLGVSLNLQQILTSQGARVVMTRTTDRPFHTRGDEGLGERVSIVNGARPDLFLSIHTNYVGNAAPRGFEVWVPRGSGRRETESRTMATLVRGELASVWNSEDRGTKDEHNLRVLKGTHCPAVL